MFVRVSVPAALRHAVRRQWGSCQKASIVAVGLRGRGAHAALGVSLFASGSASLLAAHYARPTHCEEKLRLFRPTVCLEAAEAIVNECLLLRQNRAILPLALVVLDAGGSIVSAYREDGCAVMRIDIALGMAWGALSMGMPSRQMRDRLGSRPAFMTSLTAIGNRTGKGWVAVPGGVILLDSDGYVAGALGISGDTSDKDEMVAVEAVLSAGASWGLEPDPSATPPDWHASSLSH